ncbi:MAG TPA: ECF transporter S component [Bacillota bacterium]|nr:ECF transporter S component [Bacillota bacterium]HAV21042.1 ECF transporter S component [Bacillota bacterium]HOB89013.1 ECF transporter S component [Bacillota bacterium]HOJ58098.1 ECF transporter S component [Bacillota bacterium]HOL02342.1 ECF transporter S component [Bacillota bacterium]
MKLNTKQIVISGLLVALALVLGVTGLGFVPVPTPAGAATLMHLPVELAGILQGPVVGSFVGLIFGLFTLRFLPDPRVVIPARLLIGIVSYLVYAGCGKKSWSIPLAAIAGSLTNTVGTLGLAVVFGYIPFSGPEGAIGIALLQGVPEAILAAVVITPVAIAVKRLEANRPLAYPIYKGK